MFRSALDLPAAIRDRLDLLEQQWNALDTRTKWMVAGSVVATVTVSVALPTIMAIAHVPTVPGVAISWGFLVATSVVSYALIRKSISANLESLRASSDRAEELEEESGDIEAKIEEDDRKWMAYQAKMLGATEMEDLGLDGNVNPMGNPLTE